MWQHSFAFLICENVCIRANVVVAVVVARRDDCFVSSLVGTPTRTTRNEKEYKIVLVHKK